MENSPLKKFIENYDGSNGYFSEAIKLAVYDYELPAPKLADEFQVAESTIERWVKGTAVPHPNLRIKILEWIAENS
ncbi:MAG: hypothetical protein V1914_04260 [archaeon]